MTDERDISGRTPSEERAAIGTPAGESPIEGRARHTGERMHEDEDVSATRSRKKVLEETIDVDFPDVEAEITTRGGLRGEISKGGV
jgi:hypothetical protein